MTASALSTTRLPHALYSAAEVRALEEIVIREHDISGAELMQRAGRAALDTLLAVWPRPGTLHVICGTGNNGGDGFVVAELARARGLPVCTWQVGEVDRIRGDARGARMRALADGVVIRPLQEAITGGEEGPGALAGPGVIVDAVLGTGIHGTVRESAAQAIQFINASGLPVLSLDVPSGLCSDTGRVLGCAVNAAVTVSFVGLKRGLLTGEGPSCTGAVRFADLKVPAAAVAQVSPSARRLLRSQGMHWLAPRSRTAHKGNFGHVLIIGGNQGMAGAAVLAAQAAGRVGAGWVSCATRPEHVPALIARCPEVMARGVRSGQELDSMLEHATVGVIGPGLGRDAWAEQLLQAAWNSALPLVVDADALNLIAAGRATNIPREVPWIMTPHPGEAARLLDTSVGAVQADRFAAAHQLVSRYQAGVVLKGAGTLVLAAEEGPPGVCSQGNPGMASGGMGDVLSGVMGGLLAQGVPLSAAAELGVCLHSTAADQAIAEGGERGLLASDLLAPLWRLVNEY